MKKNKSLSTKTLQYKDRQSNQQTKTYSDTKTANTHEAFRAFVLANDYPCIMSQSALRTDNYHFHLYSEMVSSSTTLALISDLYKFIDEFPIQEQRFATFVACFERPILCEETEFESLLWQQLQAMHDEDAKHHNWDTTVSSNPHSPEFSFSIGNRAFFVVGMHPGASRMARRFRLPTLVFNAHEQFENLRRADKYRPIKQLIRERDERLQGFINPVLSNFGDASEARQYSGRQVELGWHCPFHTRRPMNQTKQTTYRLAPQTGRAFQLRKGETLRVIDPQGEQVSDLFALSKSDKSERLSSGRSLDYASKIYFSEGDVLYSDRSNPMLRILSDTVGRHDFLLTPCSQKMFEILHDCNSHHPSCFENLVNALQEFGVAPDQIGTTFNIFMNVEVDTEGNLSVLPPYSKAGDYIDFKAEMDLIIGLTACSAEQSNNGTFKPIDYQIHGVPAQGETA